MSAIEKLAHLFARYDREHELFKEHIRREGFIKQEVDRINHTDESRPE